jgi:predicted nicotinamide N-methyase
MDLVCHELSLPGGALRVFQPDEAADLPDDGPVEWAPLMPYWAVLWRSGTALGRELADGPRLDGLRVIELGCGLGVPSLVAARLGADVLATDEAPEALELVERSARENGLDVATGLLNWDSTEVSPFDLVLAADVLYEEGSIDLLLSLLPALGREVLLADPGRPGARAFIDRAGRDWSVSSTVRDGVDIHRLRAQPSAASSTK